uniref:(northern house mosquito) hypothetical protein n=1 Tax=Culex pipiens TaxID=7175 RepID=A0A8D8G2K2_CULPI
MQHLGQNFPLFVLFVLEPGPLDLELVKGVVVGVGVLPSVKGGIVQAGPAAAVVELLLLRLGELLLLLLGEVHLDDVLGKVGDHEAVALLGGQFGHLDLDGAHWALDKGVVPVQFVRHVDHLLGELQLDWLLVAPHLDQLDDNVLDLLDACFVTKRRVDRGLFKRKRRILHRYRLDVRNVLLKHFRHLIRQFLLLLVLLKLKLLHQRSLLPQLPHQTHVRYRPLRRHSHRWPLNPFHPLHPLHGHRPLFHPTTANVVITSPVVMIQNAPIVVIVNHRIHPLQLVRRRRVVQVGTHLQQQLPVAGHQPELARRIVAEDVKVKLRQRHKVDQLLAREPLHVHKVVVVKAAQAALLLVAAHLEQVLEVDRHRPADALDAGPVDVGGFFGCGGRGTVLFIQLQLAKRRPFR